MALLILNIGFGVLVVVDKVNVLLEVLVAAVEDMLQEQLLFLLITPTALQYLWVLLGLVTKLLE